LKAIGFVGSSGAGKTTLIERLIERFCRAGLRVAAVKHAHHGFDIDRPGKDSYRFRSAGASQVLIGSGQRWALLSEEDPAHTPGQDDELTRQLARLAPCDLVLIEGYRGQGGVPFIEVRRSVTEGGRSQKATEQTDTPMLAPGAIAVVTDRPPEPGPIQLPVPILDVNDVEAIARFIAERFEVPLC